MSSLLHHAVQLGRGGGRSAAFRPRTPLGSFFVDGPINVHRPLRVQADGGLNNISQVKHAHIHSRGYHAKTYQAIQLGHPVPRQQQQHGLGKWICVGSRGVQTSGIGLEAAQRRFQHGVNPIGRHVPSKRPRGGGGGARNGGPPGRNVSHEKKNLEKVLHGKRNPVVQQQAAMPFGVPTTADTNLNKLDDSFFSEIDARSKEESDYFSKPDWWKQSGGEGGKTATKEISGRRPSTKHTTQPASSTSAPAAAHSPLDVLPPSLKEMASKDCLALLNQMSTCLAASKPDAHHQPPSVKEDQPKVLVGIDGVAKLFDEAVDVISSSTLRAKESSQHALRDDEYKGDVDTAARTGDPQRVLVHADLRVLYHFVVLHAFKRKPALGLSLVNRAIYQGVPLEHDFYSEAAGHLIRYEVNDVKNARQHAHQQQYPRRVTQHASSLARQLSGTAWSGNEDLLGAIVYGSRYKYSSVMKVLDVLLESPNFRVDRLVTANSLISVMRKNRDVARGNKFANAVRTQPLDLNSKFYGELILLQFCAEEPIEYAQLRSATGADAVDVSNAPPSDAVVAGKRVWKEMLDAKVLPNTIIYNLMIQSLARVGRLDDAKAFLEELCTKAKEQKRDGHKPAYGDPVLEPSARSFVPVLAILAAEGCTTAIEEITARMTNEFHIPPSKFVYTPMITAYGMAGLPARSREIFDEMISQDLPKMDSRPMIALLYAYACDPTYCFNCADLIKEFNLSPREVMFIPPLIRAMERGALFPSASFFIEWALPFLTERTTKPTPPRDLSQRRKVYTRATTAIDKENLFSDFVASFERAVAPSTPWPSSAPQPSLSSVRTPSSASFASSTASINLSADGDTKVADLLSRALVATSGLGWGLSPKAADVLSSVSVPALIAGGGGDSRGDKLSDNERQHVIVDTLVVVFDRHSHVQGLQSLYDYCRPGPQQKSPANPRLLRKVISSLCKSYVTHGELDEATDLMSTMIKRGDYNVDTDRTSSDTLDALVSKCVRLDQTSRAAALLIELHDQPNATPARHTLIQKAYSSLVSALAANDGTWSDVGDIVKELDTAGIPHDTIVNLALVQAWASSTAVSPPSPSFSSSSASPLPSPSAPLSVLSDLQTHRNSLPSLQPSSPRTKQSSPAPSPPTAVEFYHTLDLLLRKPSHTAIEYMASVNKRLFSPAVKLSPGCDLNVEEGHHDAVVSLASAAADSLLRTVCETGESDE
eukprot:TRINITY_DN6941_c0_g1_i2.p1 TRINITY_DN6941_c0_g1~~TRINITY_DN6941_c0_g1_i2.p1  ORF type:complete len:1218 (+),score=242.18 TRINITY_DN6941_c0_g1_i2:1921-5574(+)